MKTKRFYDTDHAVQYLASSVILIAGKPCYVKNVRDGRRDGSYTIIYFECDPQVDRKESAILSDNPMVDMNPIPLGFLPIFNDTTPEYKYSPYLYRNPVRKWKIGLNAQNVCMLSAGGKYPKQFSTENVYFTLPFINMVKDKYPDFKTSYDWAVRFNGAYAFSRRFAVGNLHELFYRHIPRPVGKIADGKPVLDERYKYLREVLEEDTGNAPY